MVFDFVLPNGFSTQKLLGICNFAEKSAQSKVTYTQYIRQWKMK